MEHAAPSGAASPSSLPPRARTASPEGTGRKPQVETAQSHKTVKNTRGRSTHRAAPSVAVVPPPAARKHPPPPRFEMKVTKHAHAGKPLEIQKELCVEFTAGPLPEEGKATESASKCTMPSASTVQNVQQATTPGRAGRRQTAVSYAQTAVAQPPPTNHRKPSRSPLNMCLNNQAWKRVNRSGRLLQRSRTYARFAARRSAFPRAAVATSLSEAGKGGETLTPSNAIAR